LRKYASVFDLADDGPMGWQPSHRDTRGVTDRAQDRAMTVQLSCPWCEEELAFEVDETSDELVCSGCNMRTAFAPDPGITYGLLYEPVAA
jgi:hypothetical protein